MNLDGNKILVFRNVDDGKVKYRTSISNTNARGEKEWCSLYVNFKKELNADVPDRSVIVLKKAFLTFFKVKDVVMRNGNAIEKPFDKLGIMVTDYRYDDEDSQEVEGFESVYDQIPF